MHKSVLFVLGLLASLSQVQAQDATCTTVDPESNETLTFKSDGVLLTIDVVTAAGETDTVKFNLTKVLLPVAPTGQADLTCSDANHTFMVWEKIARIDSSYYRLQDLD
jgi:hypothetical protein